MFGQVVGDTAYFETQKQLGTTIALTISMTFPVFTIFFSIVIFDCDGGDDNPEISNSREQL